MRAIFICLFPGIFLSVVSFSQTDTTETKNYAAMFQHKHFNNPFYNLPEIKSTSTASFSLLRHSELHVASHTAYSFTPYSAYTENTPVWKELISTAAKIAIQAYEDNHSLSHFYPNQ